MRPSRFVPPSNTMSGPKLGVKYVDLYLIHNPRAAGDLVQAWREFEKIKETGLSKCVLPYILPVYFNLAMCTGVSASATSISNNSS